MTTFFSASIPHYNYRGPIFRVPVDAIDQLRAYVSVVTKPDDKLFLKAIIQYSSTYGQILVDSPELFQFDIEQLRAVNETFESNNLPLGKATMSARLNRLLALGVFKKTEERFTWKTGKTNAYTLEPLDSILKAEFSEFEKLKHPPKKRDAQYFRELKDKQAKLSDSNCQVLAVPDQITKAYSERLVNNILFACGRQSVRDPRTDRIETTYRFNKEVINIIATSGGGIDIFALEDQSTVLAIVTLVIIANADRHVSGATPKNEYILDIVDLCKICGLSAEGANRTTFRKSLARLYFTNLNIACPENSEFAEFFGLNSFSDSESDFSPDNFNFRFLWQLDSAKDVEPSEHGERKPRYFRVALHPMIYRQLLDTEAWNTFVINPELIKNRAKNVTQMYFCAARYIKRDPAIARTFSFKSLQQQLMPSALDYSDWLRSVFTDFKKFAALKGVEWDGKQEITLDVYGYFMKITPNNVHGHMMTFWFNPNDPVLGKNGLMQKPNALLASKGLLDLDSDVA